MRLPCPQKISAKAPPIVHYNPNLLKYNRSSSLSAQYRWAGKIGRAPEIGQWQYTRRFAYWPDRRVISLSTRMYVFATYFSGFCVIFSHGIISLKNFAPALSKDSPLRQDISFNRLLSLETNFIMLTESIPARRRRAPSFPMIFVVRSMTICHWMEIENSSYPHVS